MFQFRKGVIYSGMRNESAGIPRDIRGPAKLRIPPVFPGLPHDWTDVEALWDTGATDSVVSDELATRLQLPVVGRTQTEGIHGIEATDVYIVDILLMGNVRFQEWRVSGARFGPSTPGLLIGMDIITKGDMTFMGNGQGGYLFSFIVPTVAKPMDFAAAIAAHNKMENSKKDMKRFMKKNR